MIRCLLSLVSCSCLLCEPVELRSGQRRARSIAYQAAGRASPARTAFTRSPARKGYMPALERGAESRDRLDGRPEPRDAEGVDRRTPEEERRDGCSNRSVLALLREAPDQPCGNDETGEVSEGGAGGVRPATFPSCEEREADRAEGDVEEHAPRTGPRSQRDSGEQHAERLTGDRDRSTRQAGT